MSHAHSNIVSIEAGLMKTILPKWNLDWGPSIKYVTLEGGGVREGVTVCDSEEGVQEHVMSHF